LSKEKNTDSAIKPLNGTLEYDVHELLDGHEVKNFVLVTDEGHIIANGDSVTIATLLKNSREELIKKIIEGLI